MCILPQVNVFMEEKLKTEHSVRRPNSKGRLHVQPVRLFWGADRFCRQRGPVLREGCSQISLWFVQMGGQDFPGARGQPYKVKCNQYRFFGGEGAGVLFPVSRAGAEGGRGTLLWGKENSPGHTRNRV